MLRPKRQIVHVIDITGPELAQVLGKLDVGPVDAHMFFDYDTVAAPSIVGIADVVVAAAADGVLVAQDEQPVFVFAGDRPLLGGVHAKNGIVECHF